MVFSVSRRVSFLGHNVPRTTYTVNIDVSSNKRNGDTIVQQVLCRCCVADQKPDVFAFSILQ